MSRSILNRSAYLSLMVILLVGARAARSELTTSQVETYTQMVSLISENLKNGAATSEQALRSALATKKLVVETLIDELNDCT